MHRPCETSRVRTEKGKGLVVPRRFWTGKEEETLLHCLEMLRSEGMKLDGSLRGGYVNRVENLMEERLPGCGIKAKHVRSKVTVWKKTHAAMATILNGSGSAGFSLSPSTHMLVEEKPQAWAEIEKVYPEYVKLLRGKSMPWYDRWSNLFGNDRATGTFSCDIGDAMDELQVSSGKKTTANDGGQTNTDDEADATSDNIGSTGCTQVKASTSSKKRKKMTDSLQMKELTGDMMTSTHKAFGELAKSLLQPASNTAQSISDDDAKKAGLYQEIVVLPGLSLDQVLWATRHLANNRNDMLAFHGIPFEVRSAFVMSLLGAYN